MNIRILKEVRAILPAWATAMLLAVFSGYGLANKVEILIWIYWLGLAGLGVSAFGHELSNKTLGMLLAQPIRRERLWLEKFAVLFAASSCVALAFFFTVSAATSRPAAELNAMPPSYLIGIMAPLCAMGGGLALPLLTKNIHASFWLSTLLPIAVFVESFWVLGKFFTDDQWSKLAPALALAYSGLGLWLSWRVLLRSNDKGTVESAMLKDIRTISLFRAGPRQTTTIALIRKELLLQQWNCLMAFAAILLFFFMATLQSQGAHDDLVRGIIAGCALFSIALLFTLFPMMIGASAISEERRLGLLEWQQALPAARSKQWFIKTGVGAFLVIFIACLGLISFFGANYLRSPHQDLGASVIVLFWWVPVLALSGGLWGSSLANDLLQSLIFGAIWITAAIWLRSVGPIYTHPISGVPFHLFAWVTLPSFSIMALYLSYRNYRRRPRLPKGLFIDSAHHLGISLITLGISAGIYYRVPERFYFHSSLTERRAAFAFPQTPGHSPVSLSSLSAIAPGHSIWTRDTHDVLYKLNEGKWTAIANAGAPYTLAIKEPGTLWSLGWNGSGVLGIEDENEFELDPRPSRKPLRQVGSSEDWAAIAAGGEHSLALKKDGSLWAWGRGAVGELGLGRTTVKKGVPTQVGNDHDWVAIVAGNLTSVALKTNGTVWYWGKAQNSRASFEPRQIGVDTNWVRIFRSETHSSGFVAVRSDSTLWFPVIDPKSETVSFAPIFDQVLGFMPKALAVYLDDGAAVTSEGYLVEWRSGHSRGLKRFGSRNDWIAVDATWGCWTALTADGWLWTWGENPAGLVNTFTERPNKLFTIYSRIPKKLINLLTGEQP